VDFTLVNQAGHTAVHKAAWKGHSRCLEWMILDDNGPKLGYQMHMQSADGRRPVDKARVNGHGAVALWLEALQDRFEATPPVATTYRSSSADSS
jgi:hypothetical protein